ncbi:MAG: hypothetical protein JWQ04_1421 [Pedosphaera sp.]|nr:hypothetical protein [Pedosphaera sp.]
MKKLILAAFTLILIGLAGWFALAKRGAQPPRASVTLPDGTSLSLRAMTYGTNHVVGTPAARAVARLPTGLQNIVRFFLGQGAFPVLTSTTSTPELLVWLDRQTNGPVMTILNNDYYTAFFGDGSNFISGEDAYLNNFLTGSPTEMLHFRTFPRRDRIITLNIFHHDFKGGTRLCASLPMANPEHKIYPKWQAEPLPVTKLVGDVEASLLGLETGHDNDRSHREGNAGVVYGTNRLDGRNYTVANLKLRPLVNTNETWQATSVEVSDATGNSAHNSGMGWSGEASEFTFSPSLWPGETAWKLKLEIKRTGGFRPEELFVFKSVPLGELKRTNVIAWTTNVGGITVTLQSIHRLPPQTNNWGSSSQSSNVKFTHSALPAGTQLDLLRVVWSTGKTNHSESWSSSGNERDYHFREIPPDAQTADFTFAIQQSRTVEFTVKPELPKPMPVTPH